MGIVIGPKLGQWLLIRYLIKNIGRPSNKFTSATENLAGPPADKSCWKGAVANISISATPGCCQLKKQTIVIYKTAMAIGGVAKAKWATVADRRAITNVIAETRPGVRIRRDFVNIFPFSY